MLYPPVADLLKNVESRYLLVNVVAQRARHIAVEYFCLIGNRNSEPNAGVAPFPLLFSFPPAMANLRFAGVLMLSFTNLKQKNTPFGVFLFQTGE